MTIDTLAQRAGVTTRKLRLYQTKGLLQPPELVGRTGHYRQAHLDRLLMIERLQSRGFSLAGIRELVQGAERGAQLEEWLGLERLMARPFRLDEPTPVTHAALVARIPALTDEKALERLVAAGALERHGDALTLVSPPLFDALEELLGFGMPLGSLLGHFEALLAAIATVVRSFAADLRGEALPRIYRERPDDALAVLGAFAGRVKPLAQAIALAATSVAIDRQLRTFSTDAFPAPPVPRRKRGAD